MNASYWVLMLMFNSWSRPIKFFSAWPDKIVLGDFTAYRKALVSMA